MEGPFKCMHPQKTYESEKKKGRDIVTVLFDTNHEGI